MSGFGGKIIKSDIWIRKPGVESPWLPFQAMYPEEVTRIQYIEKLRNEGFFVKVHDTPTANADQAGVLIYHPVERGQMKLGGLR